MFPVPFRVPALALLVVTLAASSCTREPPAPAPPAPAPGLPNVLFILADDVGWGDLACYGGRIPTPNLDRLAREGIRFTDAHASAALCAPSRFSMLTGSYPYRNGRPGGSWNVNMSCGFHANSAWTAAGRHLTVAEILGRAGYRSAFLGKMHFGGTVRDTAGVEIREESELSSMDFARGIEHFPHEHGFDHALGLPSGIQHEPFAWFENGAYRPVDPADPADNRSAALWTNGRYTMGDNGVSEIVEHPEDRPGLGDRNWDSSQVGPWLVEEALAFLDRHLAANASAARKRPFFLYYSAQAIHVPHTPPRRFPDGAPVAGTTGGATSDMLVELDLAVGVLLRRLDEAGLAADTIVFFASDNGALWPESVEYGDPSHDNNGPFRDYKASVYEGGHRVPLLVRWGDGTPEGSRIAPGTVSDELVLCHDWVATMYELTGQAMEEDQALDAASLLPLLEGRQPAGVPVHDFVIHQAGYAYDGAIRRGSHVLLVDRENRAGELYDLAADPAQEHDLSGDPAQAERVAAMHAEFLRYNDHRDDTREPRTTRPFTPSG